MSPKQKTPDYLELAGDLVSLGKHAGADQVEVTILDGSEFSLDFRLGRIENLIEAGSRHLSLKVLKNQCTAIASSSDLSWKSLKNLTQNAVKRAEISSRDEFSGLPVDFDTHIDPAALDLFDDSIDRISPDDKIRLAQETEEMALQDSRITNSHGSSFESRKFELTLVNSEGFSGKFSETYFGLGVGIQAEKNDELVEDFWSSGTRHYSDLESPSKIAQHAVDRTVRQLDAKKLSSRTIPVVFEPEMTSWLLGFLFSCVSGTSVYQGSSFLGNKINQAIAHPHISIYDDGLLPRKLGSSPFDSEGLPTRKTKVVENGILKEFLCDTYAGRKLALKSTGNSSGGGVGPNNFYLAPGESTPEEIISSMEKGLILTRVLGHGMNPVSGDLSRGAYGLWVEKGEIIHPVSEITIAGNLGEILKQVVMVGNDLKFRSQIAGPTIKIEKLHIAGT